MAILPVVGRKSPRIALVIAIIYAALVVLGASMVVPFLITLSSSASNDYDYDRFDVIPRYLWSREDRFVKGLVLYFSEFKKADEQMRACFPEMPDHWTTWQVIGKDEETVARVARHYLEAPEAERARWPAIAADYAEWAEAYPVEDCLSAVKDIQAGMYLEERYERLWAAAEPAAAAHAWASARRAAALALVGRTWGMPIESFLAVSFKTTEQSAPYWQQSYFPLEEARYADFLETRRACKDHRFTPGVRRAWLAALRAQGVSWTSEGDVFPVPATASEDLKARWLEFKKADAPAAIAVPFALRTQWRAYLDSEAVQRELALAPGARFAVADYNRLAGTQYATLAATPFPVPADAPEAIRKHWRKFVEEWYPLRLTQVRPTPALEQEYRAFLRERLRTIESANKLLDARCRGWDEFRLSASPPTGPGSANLRSLWVSFVQTLPMEERVLGGSEAAYQRFLLKKYQDVDTINKTYGWKLGRIEEATPPFDVAYAVTFLKHEAAFMYEPVLGNYAAVWKFLTETGNALFVTLALIGLTILFTLTVNPIAAYALSRFNMRGQDKIILYMLATTAFPAMVSAIPAYLLMRDLGLLNTMLALVLPGAANGMAIFILKGFFDSLPQELFEAAVIDGATEWQIFRIVAMPLIKPILAINALTAFIMAYNGWEWALIICQNRSMWTIAVWLYQANEWWAYTPWVTTAGFVLASIPTLLVFVFCQKVILRGIIIPSMK